MDIEIKNKSDWILVSMRNRVDSFNYNDFKERVHNSVKDFKVKMAIDMEDLDFISLPGIQLISHIAEELEEKGGQLALLAPSEKIKRQIDIFASLDRMKLFRSQEEWEEKI